MLSSFFVGVPPTGLAYSIRQEDGAQFDCLVVFFSLGIILDLFQGVYSFFFVCLFVDDTEKKSLHGDRTSTREKRLVGREHGSAIESMSQANDR